MRTTDLHGTTMAERRAPTSFDEALRVLAIDPEEVRAVARSQRGTGYLVGSLAAGLGDRYSDIDLHFVVRGADSVPDPSLAFTSDGTCLDIHSFAHEEVNRLVRLPPGRTVTRQVATLLSRWVGAVPLDTDGAPLLQPVQANAAADRITESMLAEVVTLGAFVELGAQAGVGNLGHLRRRFELAIWDLAACLSGATYLGTRWLPARSTDPTVAAIAAALAAQGSPVDAGLLLDLVGLADEPFGPRVHLGVHPLGERWSILGTPHLLIGTRGLVPLDAEPPPTIAAASGADAERVLRSLVDGALVWTVDLAGLQPRLRSAP